MNLVRKTEKKKPIYLQRKKAKIPEEKKELQISRKSQKKSRSQDKEIEVASSKSKEKLVDDLVDDQSESNQLYQKEFLEDLLLDDEDQGK